MRRTYPPRKAKAQSIHRRPQMEHVPTHFLLVVIVVLAVLLLAAIIVLIVILANKRKDDFN